MSTTAVSQVRLDSIGKRYSGTKALDNVSVEVAGGTVHALVGANGAGKSTLGKIIGGVIRPDDGQMFVNDLPVRYSSPREARIDGIVTISQELSPMPHMTVIENVYFGIEPRRAGIVQFRQMRRQYAELVGQWGFELDGNARVESLRTADLQKAEILRAVATDAQVIVMDEPTSSLTSVETEKLHRMIDVLRERGRTIIYVSHFLDEVLGLADTITVLRSGRLVRTAPVSEETEESLVAGMFGAAAAAEHFEKPKHSDVTGGLGGVGPAPQGRTERHLAADPGRRDRRPGRPDRQRPLRAGPRDSGRRRGRSWHDRRRRHRAPYPVARGRDGGRGGVPAREPQGRRAVPRALHRGEHHLRGPALGRRRGSGCCSLVRERSRTRELLDLTSVQPPNPSAKVGNLSGGNQQKVLFARWLFRNPRVLILDEPTRGVDVAARAAIHRLINKLAAEGTAVLLISSEIEEVLGLAHRVLVMRRGSITREFSADPPMEAVMEAAFGLGGRTVA